MTSGPTKNELPGHLSHAFPVLILSPYLSGSIDCEEHLLLILDSGKNDFESPKEPSCRWCRWRLHCKGAASSVHTAWEFLEFYDFIELFYCFNYQPRKIGMTKRNACCSYREPTIRQNSKWLYLFHRERERGRELLLACLCKRIGSCSSRVFRDRDLHCFFSFFPRLNISN